MIKFIKEIFSFENLKKAMVYSSFMNPRLNVINLSLDKLENGIINIQKIRF